MVKRSDKKPSSENYSFIKETIKEHPTDKKNPVKKFLTAAVCGVIFGGCAVGTVALFLPGVIETIEDSTDHHTEVTLVPAVTEAPADLKEQEQTETGEGTANTRESGQNEAQSSTAEDIAAKDTAADDAWAELVRNVAEVPRKALVRILALGNDADLLDDSFLKYGEEEGFVFLKNDKAFYIMTYSDNMDDAGKFQVTFSNGDMADATLCKSDSRTGFLVFQVPFTDVKDATAKDIPQAALAGDDDIEQMDAVIAVGSPTGDYDSLVSGMITSVTGTMKVADEEYGMLTTNMVGSEDGGGLLLNMSGEVVGIICGGQEDENNSAIRAVEATQLRSLLEGMANGDDICYIGIHGATISEYQVENLGLPEGIYVDSVEADSPAMTAGVQSGDIVHTLDGQEIRSMDDYSSMLQSLNRGSKVKLEIYRRNSYGTYVNVELNVIIKEK